MTIATLLRSGGDFDARWVAALARGIRDHLPPPHRFVCLTDMDVPGVEAVPLLHAWPGWWSCMELLRPDYTTGRVVSMDLDTLPVGDLSALADYTGEFGMLWALREANRKRGQRISGLLSFRAGPGTVAAGLYEAFRLTAAESMRRYRGDGEWLDAHVPKGDGLQDHIPGIYSLKWHARHAPPDDARLVLGHGFPRLSDPMAGWAWKAWARRAA